MELLALSKVRLLVALVEQVLQDHLLVVVAETLGVVSTVEKMGEMLAVAWLIVVSTWGCSRQPLQTTCRAT